MNKKNKLKHMKLIATMMCLMLVVLSKAQSVAINTDGSTANASAILDVKSTDKGVLIPRMTKTERNNIATPATGLLIYQNGPDSVGFYYYNGSKWIAFAQQLETTTISVIMNYVGGTNVSPQTIPAIGSYFGLTSTMASNSYYELPSAATNIGRVFYFRNNNDGTSNISTYLRAATGSLLCPGSGTCLGAGSYYELKHDMSVKTIMCISDGVNWTVGILN